jgi:YD repeat-containing protein
MYTATQHAKHKTEVHMMSAATRINTAFNRSLAAIPRHLMKAGLLGCLMIASQVYAASPVTHYEYDANGNLTKVTDGLGHATSYSYDKLNRRSTMLDANAKQTQYGYNAIDQLTTVQDPKGLTTTYTYDGLGNLLQQVSPDTGTTIKTYDDYGNVLTSTDAKGQITQYSYDALNRLTQITYHDNSQVTYVYDQGTNGLGRLSSITDSIGTISYGYDGRGHIVVEVRAIGGVNYQTDYTYNSAGQLTEVIYPSGRALSFTLDSLGRISQIDTVKAGASSTLVSNIQYQPFGPLHSLQFGNNTSYTRQYDTDGRIVSYTLGSQVVTLGYDDASRIQTINEGTLSRSYGYDALDRLTGYIDPSTSHSYDYDDNGNRTNKMVGTNNHPYTYAANNNRLASAEGKIYTYDANGSPINDNLNQYTYDTRGRLVQATTSGGTYHYGINALGQRVQKAKDAETGTVYHYDLNGHLIAESDAAGQVQKEYIYLYDMPLAVMK